MPAPQLSVRSEKARALARALSERTGRPINAIVEEALEAFTTRLEQDPKRAAWAQLWEITDRIAAQVQPGTGSDDDNYDENGVPR